MLNLTPISDNLAYFILFDTYLCHFKVNNCININPEPTNFKYMLSEFNTL